MNTWNYTVQGDDETRIATVYDTVGNVIETRPYNAEENARADAKIAYEAEVTESQRLTNEIGAAVDEIIRIRTMAEADQTTAVNLRTQALELSGLLATQATQIAGFTPSSTYKASDLALVRDQMVLMAQRQKTIIDALADFYSYRRVNDESTVTIYNCAWSSSSNLNF